MNCEVIIFIQNITLVIELDPELFVRYLMFLFYVKISLGEEGTGTSPIEMAETVVAYLEHKGYLKA